MHKIVTDFISYITASDSPKHNKQVVQDAAAVKFKLTKDRSVFYCDYFAVRFCYSKNSSFSNTVLSLSALHKYDTIPFLVVLVSLSRDNHIFLSNSTFLKKISHSSQELSSTNIRGSFNGSDIMREYGGVENCGENIAELFAFHRETAWNENLERLVETSCGIIGNIEKYIPSAQEVCNIFNSIERATQFARTKEYAALKDDLDTRVERAKNCIMIASHIENVNIRGRLIEALIASDEATRCRLMRSVRNMEEALPTYDTKNGLGDYCRSFQNASTCTDIKTKILYLASNPKAYNIDKFLRYMAEEQSVFFIYFVGIDEKSVVNSVLCSVYHHELLKSTVIQRHWSGRCSRGAAQFVGKVINEILLADEFVNNIDAGAAKVFLNELVEL